MEKPEPLRGKTKDRPNMSGGQGNFRKYYFKEDIKSAVEWLELCYYHIDKHSSFTWPIFLLELYREFKKEYLTWEDNPNYSQFRIFLLKKAFEDVI